MKLRKQRAGPLVLVEAMGLSNTPQYWRAGLAQLVEHLICNQGATGSNPVAGTILLKDLATIITPSGVPVESHVITT